MIKRHPTAAMATPVATESVRMSATESMNPPVCEGQPGQKLGGPYLRTP